MKLIKFTFHDRIKNWGFTDLKFDDINLFIGASGVGKSLILEAVSKLKKIISGDQDTFTYNGVMWDLEFEMDGKSGNWIVEFQNNSQLAKSLPIEEKSKSRIEFEKEIILIDGIEVLSRINGVIKYEGEKFPFPIESSKSLVELIQLEYIWHFKIGLNQIRYVDFTLQNKEVEYGNYITNFIDQIAQIRNIHFGIGELKNKDWHLLFKLYSVYELHPEFFQEINQVFCNIFTNVDYLSFETTGRFSSVPNSSKIEEIFELRFKEKDVDNSLRITSLSSGMYRTLIHICELYLSPKGTVFLYDEFENSLGINCIDEITDLILSSENDYQFILTSHHPYIINNIPAEYWRLVTRHGGEVKISNVYDEGIIDKKSKHEVFTQLINSSKFYNRD